MDGDLGDLLLTEGSDTANCFVCGEANESGLHVAFERDGENGSRALYTAQANHNGWPGLLHGGVALTLMDEAVAWALVLQGLRGVTARVQANFRRPIRTGTTVIIRGWVVGRQRRLVTARAEIHVVGGNFDLLADMDATIFLLAENAPTT